MSDALNQGITETMNNASKIIITSLMAYVHMFPKSKKKIDKQTARDNYCKSVLLLWGFMQFELDKLDDNMFYRVQLISANILYGALSRKEFEPLYLGAGLSKTRGKDHPKLCYEMIKWFNKNDKLPGVESIITTGKHLFALKTFSGKLEDKHTEAFYKMGSLCEEGYEGINVMKSVLIDSKIKFNF